LSQEKYRVFRSTQEIISGRKMAIKTIEKCYKNRPLTDEQKISNKEKSRIRSRVDHVFGFMEQCMNGMKVKNKGKISSF